MTDFAISFVARSPFPANVASDSIFVWPVDPNWNDFGYGFQAKAYVRIGDIALNAIKEFSLFVVPWPLDGNLRFNSWLESERRDHPPDAGDMSPPGGFFTILKNESHYRALMEFCGSSVELASRILRPLRDAVYRRWKDLDYDQLREFVRSEAVTKGIFRYEGAYLAWHRGITILAGQPANPVADAQINFEFSANLPGFSGEHRLQVRFGVPAPLVDRCHALIGRNGVGKSQFLRELIIELGSRIDGTATTPFIDEGTPNGRGASIVPETFTVNRVLVMTWDNRSQLPQEARMDTAFQYLNFPMTEPASDNMVVEQTHRVGSETQTAMLIQLLREDESNSRASDERLRRVLLPVLDVGKIAVYLEPSAAESTGRWIELRSLSHASETQRLEYFGRIDLNSDPVRVDEQGMRVPLSSGERTFLNFGIRCAARLTTGALLVLDEPETHLHPNLISGFMRVLESLLVETRSIALIATHSPFIVRELPGRCVHVIKVDEHRLPSISNAFLRTLGASIDQLSVDIFDDAESHQPNGDLALMIAKGGLTFDEVRTQYARDISPDMLGEIRELMSPPGDE